MDPEAEDLARRAAAALTSQFGPQLPAQVEAALQGGAAGQTYLDPMTISVATLLLNIVKFAWDIYKDNKKTAAPPPSSDVIARRIRVEVDLPSGVTEAQRDQIITVVVAERPRQ